MSVTINRIFLAIVLLSPFLFNYGITPAQATPEQPGYVPDQVGNMDRGERSCDLLIIGVFGCKENYARLDKLYTDAYQAYDKKSMSPGWPTNDVHIWKTVLIQDFVGGGLDSRTEGALIMKWKNAKLPPYYVWAILWDVYKRAANNHNVFPGYPINDAHQWNKVFIQDYREGSWGDGAIIMRPGFWKVKAKGEFVAGNHWKAYIMADGSNRLLIPQSFVYKKNGYWVQDFDGGSIYEKDGKGWIYYNDTGRSEPFTIK